MIVSYTGWSLNSNILAKFMTKSIKAFGRNREMDRREDDYSTEN